MKKKYELNMSVPICKPLNPCDLLRIWDETGLVWSPEIQAKKNAEKQNKEITAEVMPDVTQPTQRKKRRM